MLVVLADVSPNWTLTGGGALSGFHLGHRETKYVDLLFPGRAALDDIPRDVKAKLSAAGLPPVVVQSSPALCRLRVASEGETLLIDLVAEPVPNVAPPESRSLHSATISVDAAQEILGNKMAALYSRWEIRDLVDIQALAAADYDLELGLSTAAAKDGGFGRADLAWVLTEMRIRKLADAEGYDGAGLERFARSLRDHLLRTGAAARP